MHKKIIGLAFVLLSWTIIQSAYSLEPKNWQQTTINDLHTMHDTLVTDTPQYIDKLPAFMAWLDTGLTKSLMLAQKVGDEAGYYFTLAYYAQGFNNGHIRINFKDLPAKYAGLLLQYQNGAYRVKERDVGYKNLPPLSAELVSCDGKLAQNIIDQDIIPYRFIPKLEASSRKAAGFIFYDTNPFRHYARQCVFKENGVNKTYTMQWGDISLAKVSEIKQALNKKYNFLIERFGQNGIWISIPTLFPDEGAERNFLEMLVKMTPEYRSYDPVVLDVRGNQGGNSNWAKRLLAGLYDENYLKAAFSSKQEGGQLYRVSPNNIEHARWMAKLYPEQNDTLQMLLNAERSGQQMTKVKHEELSNEARNATSTFNNHLYFLTDENCFSACLNFADYVYWLPHTTHIGISTYADSPYTANNNKTLSGGAKFIYTLNVTRDRIRGDNQPYIPQYRYDGDIRDTDKLKQWVEELYLKNTKPDTRSKTQ